MAWQMYGSRVELGNQTKRNLEETGFAMWAREGGDMADQTSEGIGGMTGEEVEHIYEQQRSLITYSKGGSTLAAAAGYAGRRKAKTRTIRPNAPQNQV